MQSILLVDDETALTSSLCEALQAAQFDCLAVQSNSQAQIVLAENDFDAFVIDLRLPDGSGLDLAGDIRARFDRPIIMMSGMADDIDRIVGLEMAADDYLQKPFLQRELVARIRAVLRRYGGDSVRGEEVDQRIDSFHGFELDYTSREVNDADGQNVELTTREFDVIAVLVRNRGKVLSRQEIYVQAGMGKGQADRQVDGLISRLRSKLYSETEAAKRIRTVHGRGYVLTD